MTDTTQSTAALAQLLESRLVEWERARKPQELKLLECYQDVMRIARDDDTTGTGTAKSRKAKSLFIGSTRNKVRSARAKINDALFGNGKMPFDTTPTNEELKDFADTVEDIVTEQMERMGLKPLLKNGVDTLATYGTGFIFGPFVRKECITETMADNSLGYTEIKEEKYEFDSPYFELASTLDVYPDPEARRLGDGLGVFWTTMESKHTVRAWKADKSYSDIDQALIGAADNGNETGSDLAGQTRANIEFWHKNERIKVARFFGLVPKSTLSGSDVTDSSADVGEMVRVIVIMAGGVVVKHSESPYGDKDPAHSCAYEEVPNEIWGVGPAENNAPHQKVTNAAFRLFMEGKGMALLGTKSVDRSLFMPTEDFKKYPGKVYQMKPGLSPDERKSAIIEHPEVDVTTGWLDVIRVSEQFSDDDTGITKYTQGDDSGNLNKTAAGISMIMSASSLPIKEVIQNIDENWIEEIVEAIIEWDLKYLEVETVRKIHGEEAAEIWQAIKQFGKSSFMDWQATGTSSFMQKEVLTNKLRAFSEFALSNPMTAAKVDVTELLEQTWDCMEIGKESPILKDEDGQPPIPPQVQQQMEQIGEALKAKDAELQKLQGIIQGKVIEAESRVEVARTDNAVKAEDANDKNATEQYRAETERMAALGPAITPEMVRALVMQTVQEMLSEPPQQPAMYESQEMPTELAQEPMQQDAGYEQMPMQDPIPQEGA